MNKLKLIVCAFLTTAVAASVILLPHFYYYLTDKRFNSVSLENIVFEDTGAVTYDFDKISEIVTSNSSIWFDDYLNVSYENISRSLKKAVDEFREFCESDEVDLVLKSITEYLQNEENNYVYTDTPTVTGEVNGALYSASFLRFVFDDDCVFFEILLDRKTNKIYELYYENYLEAISNQQDREAYDISIKSVYNSLIKYLDSELPNYYAFADEYSLGFYAFGRSYTDLRYNVMEYVDSAEVES